ncbi:MAG: site-2 protease family protein [Marmoricola sp.]
MARPDARPAYQPAGSVRIGSVFGVDVFVRASWFVIALVIASLLEPRIEAVHPGLGIWKYVAGLGYAVLLYGSILLHEMSHAVVAQRAGLPVRSITLEFLGGSTHIEAEAKSAGQEFRIAVVGPITSLAVGGLALLVLLGTNPSGLTELAIQGLAGTNLVVGLLNLVPGLPLDGGRVLRAAVWQLRGNMHTGTIVAAWGGRITAIVALGYPFVSEPLFGVHARIFDYVFAFMIFGFLWSAANFSLASAQIRRRLPSLQARPLARRVVVVPGELPIAEAVRRAQEAGAGGMAVHGSHEELTGIVNETALLSVPEERRPWVPISSVTRNLSDGLVLPAGLTGEDLVRAMARTPATEYLLVEDDGSLYGLLVTDDVDAAFDAAAQKTPPRSAQR